MLPNDLSQNFLLTFRNNGQAHGEPLVEILAEELAAYDPSVAEGAYKRTWFGNEDAMKPMVEELGLAAFDVQGVLAALHDHRGADRRLAVNPDQLEAAGFREVI